MHYNSPGKTHREKHWVRVNNGPDSEGKNRAHKWCNDNPSTGNFYHFYAAPTWWFENSEDALLFKLKWCNLDYK